MSQNNGKLQKYTSSDHSALTHNLLSTALDLQARLKSEVTARKVEAFDIAPIETQALWDELVERDKEGSI